MRVEEGTVKEVRGGMLLVETSCETMCASCAAKSGCSVAGEPEKKREFMMENTLSAVPGERVTFGIKEGQVVVSSLLQYFFPIISLIAGICIGAEIMPDMPDAGPIIGGVSGLLISFFIIFAAGKVIKHGSIIKPVLLEVIQQQHG
jgi:positive regulator of sigma E activity